jgi:hypothetical protein
MRRVKSKWILGKLCKISYVDLSDEHADGLFYPDEFRIEIEKTLTWDDFQHSRLHEEFHAAWERLSLEQANISDDAVEIIINGLSKYVTEQYKLVDKKKK